MMKLGKIFQNLSKIQFKAIKNLSISIKFDYYFFSLYLEFFQFQLIIPAILNIFHFIPPRNLENHSND